MNMFTMKSSLRALAFGLVAMLAVIAASPMAQAADARINSKAGAQAQAQPANLSFGNGKYGPPQGVNSGKTTCGGLVNGKLQKPCGTQEAVFEADAVGQCPEGSFFDLTRWSCYKCPAGFVRNGMEQVPNDPFEKFKAIARLTFPVDGPRACNKRNAARQPTFSVAKKRGGQCPDGSFFDPIRGGECFTCPEGYKRTIAHIDTTLACEKPSSKSMTKATYKGKAWGLIKTDCNPGQFAADTNCYACPDGYKHDILVHQDKIGACFKITPATSTNATTQGKAGCQPGEFFDLIDDGSCWTCPEEHFRTTESVKSARACKAGGGWDFATAEKISPLTCDSGQTFDFVNAQAPKAKALITKQKGATEAAKFGGPKKGGTCWSCPAGFRRTVAAVWSPQACESNGITWEQPPYYQPGLLGMDGAADVVKELIAERTTIDEIAMDLINASNVKVEGMGMYDIWAEIATSPNESAALQLAVFSRVQAAATTPGSASAADKKLLAGFQEAVKNYRVFLAQQAFQAYNAWDVADKKKSEVYHAVMIAGVTTASVATGFGSTAALYAAGAEALRNELWPVPDFTDITLQSVLEDQLKGEVVGFVYAKGMMSPKVIGKFFPADKAILKATQKTMTEGTDILNKKLAAFITQKLSKKAAQKAAGTSAKVTAKMVSKAFMSAGPQIMVELAIDTVIAYIEMQIDRANAPLKLQALVAEASRPFDVARLMATADGAAEVGAQWATMMGGNGLPSASDRAAIETDAAAIALTYNVPAASAAPAATLAAVAPVAQQAPKAPVVASAAPTSAPTLTAWKKIAGWASDIGAGPAGRVAVVSRQGKVFDWDQGKSNWNALNGILTRVDMTPDGTTVGVNDKGEIWAHIKGQWSKMNAPAAQDIGVGADGTTWFIGTTPNANGFDVFRWENNRFVPVRGGSGVRLDVDPKGNAWVISQDGKLSVFDGKRWKPDNKAPQAKDIAVGGNGSVYLLAMDGTPYVQQGMGWKQLPGKAENITVDAAGVPWVTNANNEVYTLQ